MNIQSLWTKEYKKPSTSKKKKMENTDILIIGGGITGISCAYFLKDSGYKVTLVDKGTIGMGITSRTTAKVNYLQGTIYQDLE
ncbi:MAG: FAD-binding oxidoreductase, partial [Bacilli bacterium]|nr:FAD-binding oxidoreductase [Bacilli bacterium]